jgi:hypothetical protein
MENFTNDSGWIVIWQDIKNGGLPLTIFLSMVAMWFLKPYISNIFSFLGKLITRKLTKENRQYSVADVKCHPVFKDLEFWLSIGIKSLNFSSIDYIKSPINKHHETKEYTIAKEEIAKDILIIKFSNIKETIETFLKEQKIECLDLESAKTYITTYLHKCEIKQHADMIDAKIPSQFLKKYFIYEKMTNDLFYQVINSYLNDEAFNDLSVVTRIYLVFNTINNYLIDAYNNMIFTVNAINGDLNGVEYKGHVIGEKKQKVLQPPHSTFVYSAKEILTHVMTEFGASRATLIKYYHNSDGVYVHSAVYETHNIGVMPVLNQIQNIPNNLETDVLEILKNGTIISVDISKFNNNIIERLSHRGINAVIIVPIFDGNDFSGTLMLDYLSIEKYNIYKDIPNLDEKLHKYAKDVAPFISYPKNYQF